MNSKFSLSGSYRIVTLRSKPGWVPQKIWMKLYHAGLLKPWIKNISPVYHNLIMMDTDVGLNLVMRQLAGDTRYPLEIDSAGIGTGSTAPSSSDTNLEAPVVVGIVKSTGELTDVSTLFTEWFFTNDDLPDGTYTELALFCGTRIWCRSIISPSHTKGPSEDTLFEYSITCANS